MARASYEENIRRFKAACEDYWLSSGLGGDNKKPWADCKADARLKVNVPARYAAALAQPGAPEPTDEWCRAQYEKFHQEKYARDSESQDPLAKMPKGSKGSNPELAKFSPRELLEELKSRGYSGTLHYTYTMTI